ncbi:uncharacterized protein LOC132747429 [Ruditapes philippinarum]|uniref:uncharacterized protein LOC132747429 n=1 Tax=Ruditapes philippinarum TaxID=129788 RepID=UPI00295AC4B9|nr:uncharacterized protein LOC132747429 [Ruditapes philippinarum]
MATNKQLIDKCKSLSSKDIVSWLKSVDTCNLSVKCADSSYRSIIKRTEVNFRNLKKSEHKSEVHRRELENFLNEDLKFPKRSSFDRVQKKDPVACDNSCSYANVSYNLASQLHQAKTENEQLKNELRLLRKCKVSKSTVENMKSELKNQNRQVKSLKFRLNNKSAELKRVRLRLARSQKKNEKLSQTVVEKEMESNEIKQVNEQLNASFQENEDVIRDLPLNVPASIINPVIKCVLNLIDKQVDKLPTRTTVLNMNVERLILSQKQMNETLIDQPNLTLYTDKTTKFGTKYSGYHVSDTDGKTYVLGMREIVTKSAADTLSAFQQILGDIEDRTKEANQAAKRVLANITATMSDRASTEKKFNSLLEELRTSILPDLNENWDELSPADQIAASSLLNFFCGLHGLVHFADCANKSAVSVQKGLLEEQLIYDKSFHKQNESGASRLTRTVCKALARGADEKNGKYSEFNIYVKDFLKENNMCSLPLTPFKGNRFNILFESSAAVFFLHDKIKLFLEDNQSNNLLKSVLYDLNVVEYLAGVKAFGLISRFVTGPLWSLLEDRSVHVFDMNEHYVEFVIFLYEAVDNVDAFMKGETELFNAVHKDAIYESLIQEWEHDDHVAVYLNIMLPAMAECAKKMYADHLPGGKWDEVTPDMRLKAASTQKHNKFAESVFGYLDNLLRKKPNISVLASEAYIMFTANKTEQWIESKTEEEKLVLVNEAIKESQTVKENFTRRKAEIQQKQKEGMAERARMAAEKEARRVQKLTDYTSDIINFGLWQSEEEVDRELGDINSKTVKINALKAQLNFRKNVLKQNPTSDDMKNVYRFSKNENQRNQKLSVDELAVNLKKLVQHAFTIEPQRNDEDEQRRALLVGKTVKHKFIEDGDEKWWKGTVISQVFINDWMYFRSTHSDW